MSVYRWAERGDRVRLWWAHWVYIIAVDKDDHTLMPSFEYAHDGRWHTTEASEWMAAAIAMLGSWVHDKSSMSKLERSTLCHIQLLRIFWIVAKKSLKLTLAIEQYITFYFWASSNEELAMYLDLKFKRKWGSNAWVLGLFQPSLSIHNFLVLKIFKWSIRNILWATIQEEMRMQCTSLGTFGVLTFRQVYALSCWSGNWWKFVDLVSVLN